MCRFTVGCWVLYFILVFRFSIYFKSSHYLNIRFCFNISFVLTPLYIDAAQPKSLKVHRPRGLTTSDHRPRPFSHRLT